MYFLIYISFTLSSLKADIVPNQMEPRRFQDLLDHFDDILGSSRVDMVNSYYTEIIRIFGIEEAPDPDYFLQCYGRMAINSFNVLDVNQVICTKQ